MKNRGLSQRLEALHWFPLVSLPAGIVLLQWHGTRFWSDLTGSDVWGWGASAALEWIGLWAWARQKQAEARETGWAAAYGASARWLLFAGVCTALLVAGPLYQVGRPLLAEAHAQIALVNRVMRTDAALDVLKQESLEGAARSQRIVAMAREERSTARALSQANADARRITREIVRLTGAANEAEAELWGPAAQGAPGGAWHHGLARALAFGHLALLIVFAAGTVLAIRELAEPSAGRRDESWPLANDDSAEPIEERIRKIVEAAGIPWGGLHGKAATDFPLESSESVDSAGNGGAESAVNASAPRFAVEDREAETPEPALTVRVRKARELVESRFPLLNWEERAAKTGVRPADMSLLRNHERLSIKRAEEQARGLATRQQTRIITESALAKIEAAVFGSLAPVAAAGPSAVQTSIPAKLKKIETL